MTGPPDDADRDEADPDGQGPVSQPGVPIGPAAGPLPARPLRYAEPGTGQPAEPQTPYVGRLMIGCFGYAIVTAGWIVAGRTCGLQIAFCGWGLMTVALLALSVYLRARYRFSGVGVGILIMILIMVLIAAGLFLLLLAICGHHGI